MRAIDSIPSTTGQPVDFTAFVLADNLEEKIVSRIHKSIFAPVAYIDVVKLFGRRNSHIDVNDFAFADDGEGYWKRFVIDPTCQQ